MHQNISQPHNLCTAGPLMGILVPTLQDQTLQAIWTISIHSRPLVLYGNLHNDLQHKCKLGACDNCYALLC